MNTLTGIINPGSSKREFLYDGMSRMRVSRNWNWQNGAWVPQSEKRRVYDGMDVVQERDGANVITASYTRADNIGGILARSTSSGSVYFGYDGGGNVTELTDNAGAVVGTYAYDAFGQTVATSGAAAAGNPYRFSTKEDVGGFYYYGSRFYSPGIGRWMNRDPLRESGGLNVYGFNRNSPTNFVDPDGACPTLVTGAIGAAGGALVGGGIAWWQGKSTHDIWVAAGRGAVIGGIVGLTGGAAGGFVSGALGGGFWAGAAAGVTAGVVGDVAGQSAEKLFGWRECYDWNQTLMSGGLGGLTGGVSAAGWLCFARGTRVLMADGTTKPIEEVKAGDQVLSRDESSGKTEAKKVKQTFKRQADATLVLHFSNGERIETTKEHPFYVEHKGFTPAGELGIGTSIVTRAGPSVTLVKVEVKNAATTVYNFEVEDAHSYFVGQGALWVHNVCWNPARKLSGVQNAIKHWNKHGGEFPELTNSLEYVRKAQGIIDNPSAGTYIKSSKGGTIYFDPSDGTFVASYNGTPLTMHRPADGLEHFLQRGKGIFTPNYITTR